MSERRLRENWQIHDWVSVQIVTMRLNNIGLKARSPSNVLSLLGDMNKHDRFQRSPNTEQERIGASGIGNGYIGSTRIVWRTRVTALEDRIVKDTTAFGGVILK